MNDLKQYVADAVKRAVRDKVSQSLLGIGGIEDIRVDTADNLMCHMIIKTKTGPVRMFRIKISEVQ